MTSSAPPSDAGMSDRLHGGQASRSHVSGWDQSAGVRANLHRSPVVILTVLVRFVYGQSDTKGGELTVLVTAKADYAVRAIVEIAAADEGDCLAAETIAERQEIPRPFLVKILQQLRTAGLTETVRGPVGGHRLARPAAEISIADVVRAVDGPVTNVHSVPSGQLRLSGHAAPVAEIWVELHRRVAALLEAISLSDVLTGAVDLDEIGVPVS